MIDVKKKDMKISIEETNLPTSPVSPEEKNNNSLGYPIELRESHERMVSSDALNIDYLKKKYPEYRFRYINKQWRMKEGRMGHWYPIDASKDRPVGDLSIAIIPEDLARKVDENRRKKEREDLQGEFLAQEEYAEKIHRDSEGTVRMVIDGVDKFSGKSIKKMYSVPVQIV